MNDITVSRHINYRNVTFIELSYSESLGFFNLVIHFQNNKIIEVYGNKEDANYALARHKKMIDGLNISIWH